MLRVVAALCLAPCANAESVELLSLSQGADPLASWQPRPVRGHALPARRVIAAREGLVVRVESASSNAGGWLRALAPRTSGTLQWEWRASRLPDGADLGRRDRDDAALRVFVVFGVPDDMPRAARAIFYCWGNREPTAFHGSSFVTSRFHVVRLRGAADVGPWHSERVDVFADYARFFANENEETPTVGAVGFMQDTDQTGSAAAVELRDLIWSSFAGR